MGISHFLSYFSRPTTIALDLGASTIKVVAVKRSGKSVKVVGVATEPTPPYAISDGQISRLEILLPAVKRALINAGVPSFDGVHVVVGLRGVSVVAARLSMPILNEEELAPQIIMEAQQHISTALDEWTIDYDIVSPPDERGLSVVMLVGARNTTIEGFGELSKALQTPLSIADLDVFAMTNVIEQNYGDTFDGTSLCIDFGHDASRICLLDGKLPLLVRNFSICGNDLGSVIATRCGITLEEAEILKIGVPEGTSEQIIGELSGCYESFGNDLCDEVKNTLAFCKSSLSLAGDIILDTIFLSGGGAAMPGVKEKLASVFGCSVVMANPFRRIPATPEVDEQVGELGYSYAVATGLALRTKDDKFEAQMQKSPETVGHSQMGLMDKIQNLMSGSSSSKRLVWMVAAGALAFAAITVSGALLGGGSASSGAANPTANLDETGMPKMTPEAYSKALRTLEAREREANESGKPFSQKNQLEKLRKMKEKGEIK